MKTIPVPSFEDSLVGAFNPRQIPETAFERELLRGYLETHTSNFKYSYTDGDGKLQFGTCTLRIGDEDNWDDQGRLRSTLSLEAPGEGFNLNRLMTAPLIEIFFSIEEREYPASERYRVIVNWELGKQVAGSEVGKLIDFTQSNNWPYPPVIGLTSEEVASI